MSVIPMRSMHLGVRATASHAVSTKTRFVVFYKPRYAMFSYLSVHDQVSAEPFMNFYDSSFVNYD